MGRALKIIIGLALLPTALFTALILLLWTGACGYALFNLPQASQRGREELTKSHRQEHKQQPHQRPTQKLLGGDDKKDPTRPYLHHQPPKQMFPPASQPALHRQ